MARPLRFHGRVIIRLPGAMLEAIDNCAIASKMRRSEAIRELLMDALSRKILNMDVEAEPGGK